MLGDWFPMRCYVPAPDHGTPKGCFPLAIHKGVDKFASDICISSFGTLIDDFWINFCEVLRSYYSLYAFL